MMQVEASLTLLMSAEQHNIPENMSKDVRALL